MSPKRTLNLNFVQLKILNNVEVALNKHVPFHRINVDRIYVDRIYVVRFYLGAEPETVGSVSRLRKRIATWPCISKEKRKK
jgi:hypothetical protein